MAHKKAAGTAKNLRDSAGKRLGIKLYAGQNVVAGNIICRQRGTKWMAGEGVGLGKDHTIYALRDGIVKFTENSKLRFDGRTYFRSTIHVIDPVVTPPKSKTPVKKVATASEVTEKKVEIISDVAPTEEKKPRAKKAPEETGEKKTKAPKAEKVETADKPKKAPAKKKAE